MDIFLQSYTDLVLKGADEGNNGQPEKTNKKPPWGLQGHQ